MNPLDQPTPYAGAPEWPKPFAGTPTGIIGETCSQPLHDLVHRTPTLSPTPRTDAAYFANGATMYSLAGEMKLIERELAETERLRFGADADRRQLRCELTAAKAECERWKSNAAQVGSGRVQFANELTRLRAEVERLTMDNRILTTRAESGHAQFAAAIARAEKAEAERDRADAEVAALKKVLLEFGQLPSTPP
jgi:chromosome segregation ATPase